MASHSGWVAALGALAAIGCTGADDLDATTAPVAGAGVPARLELPTGQAPPTEPAYPAPPWGYGIGSVLPSFAFVGYAAPEGGEGELGVVRMSDFYNPERDDTRPLALVVESTSLHCLPQGLAAFEEIDAGTRGRGGELLLALSWGHEIGGAPATIDQLAGVVDQHDLQSPAVIDPALELSAILHPSGPSFALIDTADMTILDVSWGYPEAPFWETLEALLID